MTEKPKKFTVFQKNNESHHSKTVLQNANLPILILNLGYASAAACFFQNKIKVSYALALISS